MCVRLSLQCVKENVIDLQQRLQQYQKKNDEMHEKVATLERKVHRTGSIREFSMNSINGFSYANRNNNVMNIVKKLSIKMQTYYFYHRLMNV
jgi:hypothetical protein